jgi:hypothetical protein
LQGSTGIQATPAYYQSTAETSQFEQVRLPTATCTQAAGSCLHKRVLRGGDYMLVSEAATSSARGLAPLRPQTTIHLNPRHRLQEWQASKRKQDAQLDRVERGVGNLAEMARGMQVRSREARMCLLG